MERDVIGVYDSMTTAEEAVRALDRGRFPIQQVSIVVQNPQSTRQIRGYVTARDMVKQGTALGAWVGGLSGLLLGATFIGIPRQGSWTVLAPLFAALLGGIEGILAGATGGGLLGALGSWAVTRYRVLQYTETEAAGQYLVVAHGSDKAVEGARRILEGTGAKEIRFHAVAGA